MKTIPFLIILLCIALYSFSQKDIKVEETNAKIADGNNNAYTMIIFEADDKNVEKAWKKLMKDYKAKVNMKKEIFADDAEISELSSNTVDVYAIVEKTKDGDSKITVAFDLGGAFLSSSNHSSQSKAAKSILRKFGVSAAKDAVLEQIKEAEKELKKMEGDKEQLIKDNEDLHKKIEGWEKDIEKAKEDIKENEKAQEEKVKEIENQNALIKTIEEKEKLIK
jgi:DNA-binding helix-hairpin-helix protein with protein kinase domain